MTGPSRWSRRSWTCPSSTPLRSVTTRPKSEATRRLGVGIAGARNARDEMLIDPSVEREHTCRTARYGEMDGAVDFRDDTHRDAVRIGMHGWMESLPDGDDPPRHAAAEARSPGTRSAQDGNDVRLTVFVVGRLEVVDVRDLSVVAVDDLAVEQQQARVDGAGNFGVHVPAFVAIISGIAAKAATHTTTSMTTATAFEKRAFV